MAARDSTLHVFLLGRTDYCLVWDEMKSFTDGRNSSTQDQLWITEHNPVFTLGQAALHQHVLSPGDIPVVSTDRGGQVTYHGPGQIVAYLLRDLRSRGDTVHEFVRKIEQSMIDVLAAYGVDAGRLQGAPGVYVDRRKIGALGIRIRRGCSYHGLSLNVAMDLEPFHRINPCGLVGMEVAQISDFVPDVDIDEAVQTLINCICERFGYEASHCNQDTQGSFSA